METLGSLCNYYQGVVDKKKKESGQSTRRRHAHMHTREDGGIDSQKVADLTRNWTFQSPLKSTGEGQEEDTEMMGLEDITAEELEAEFDRLQLITEQHESGPREQQQVRLLPSEETPPTAQLHEVYNLEEIGAIRGGVAPQSVREEPTVHDRVEQPRAWDPVDILRGYQIF